MKKSLIPYLVAFHMIPIWAFSQTDSVFFDIANIHVSTSYTKAQIVAQWGEPDVYHQHDSEFGLDESYYYGENNIAFNKGILTFFYIEDQKFPIFIKYVSGGIKVGDPITLFSHLTFGKLYFEVKAGEFTFKIDQADDWIEVTADEDGIIVLLVYVVHV